MVSEFNKKWNEEVIMFESYRISTYKYMHCILNDRAMKNKHD